MPAFSDCVYIDAGLHNTAAKLKKQKQNPNFFFHRQERLIFMCVILKDSVKYGTANQNTNWEIE